MLSLKEHTAIRLEAFSEAVKPLSEPRSTDLACDACGAELFDVPGEPAIYQLGSPPRRSVSCSACAYKGWRVMWVGF